MQRHYQTLSYLHYYETFLGRPTDLLTFCVKVDWGLGVAVVSTTLQTAKK
jgi:hypothetical protein